MIEEKFQGAEKARGLLTDLQKQKKEVDALAEQVRQAESARSLLDAEGPDVVAGFLAGNSGWRAAEQQVGAGTPRGAGLRLTPWDDSTDGFFFATLHRL